MSGATVGPGSVGSDPMDPGPEASGPVEVGGPAVDGAERILTPAALDFLAALHEAFADRRDGLLDLRRQRREQVAAGAALDFLPETAAVRAGDWRVAEIPPALRDRRVEITGPTEKKMTINALNSGAQVWLADLEDANTPHWANVLGGQVNLFDAVRGDITLDTAGRHYALAADPAVVVVRPRGWHLDEKHLTVRGRPMVAALVDFGLYFFHNAAELLARGAGPYFYLPKLESHLEARLWAEVFAFAETRLAVAPGSIRATVLIETIWAAFEMDEILHELRGYAAGLNAGRWDYLFSVVKTFRDAGPDFVLPDRNTITMAAPFLRAYSELLVSTCHRRGAAAIGGMAAFLPSRDEAANAVAFEKVRADKTREATAGYQGSWVAHPGLVALCREVFDGVAQGSAPEAPTPAGSVLGGAPAPGARSDPVPGADQPVRAEDLLAFSTLFENGGPVVTDAGVAGNVSVAVEYLANWLAGRGAVAIASLMEDAATAEISRSQLWQWRTAGVRTESGPVTAERIGELADRAAAELAARWSGPAEAVRQARDLLVELAVDTAYADFLTVRASALIP